MRCCDYTIKKDYTMMMMMVFIFKDLKSRSTLENEKRYIGVGG